MLMLERERETWNESDRLGERKKRERETYERIQGMRKKKSYKE